MRIRDLVYIMELLNKDVVEETPLKKEIQKIIQIAESGRYGEVAHFPIMPELRVEVFRGGR